MSEVLDTVKQLLPLLESTKRIESDVGGIKIQLTDVIGKVEKVETDLTCMKVRMQEFEERIKKFESDLAVATSATAENEDVTTGPISKRARSADPTVGTHKDGGKRMCKVTLTNFGEDIKKDKLINIAKGFVGPSIKAKYYCGKLDHAVEIVFDTPDEAKLFLLSKRKEEAETGKNTYKQRNGETVELRWNGSKPVHAHRQSVATGRAKRYILETAEKNRLSGAMDDQLVDVSPDNITSDGWKGTLHIEEDLLMNAKAKFGERQVNITIHEDKCKKYGVDHDELRKYVMAALSRE